MNPYYQDDFVTLYHADCLQHLDMLDQADVLITDPPYGIEYQSNRARTRDKFSKIVGDKDAKLRDLVVVAWGYKPALVFGKWTVDRPAGTRQRLIWDKVKFGMGDLTSRWAPTDEEIYVLGQWPAIKPGGSIREGGTPERFSNIIRIPTINPQAKDRPNHPTPKPVPLMETLITACPEHWVIVDPFAGSGSTLRAAKNLGRKAIGFEIEEKYCEITAQRLAQETLGIF